MSRIKKAERFLLARVSLIGAGVASAVFGVAGWWSAQPDFASIALIGFTALSAAVIPATFEVVGRNRWSFLLIPAALVFGGINAYSFHHAVDHLIEQPRRDAYQLAEVAPKQVVLDAASVALAAHTAPVFPDTMGPKNIAARMDGWKLVHQPLIEAEAKAKADLKMAKEAYQPFVPNAYVWGCAAALDLALALGLAGITLVRTSTQKQTDRKAEKLKHQATQIAALEESVAEKIKALKKATRQPAKPKAPKEVRPLRGFTPYVAVSND